MKLTKDYLIISIDIYSLCNKANVLYRDFGVKFNGSIRPS